MPAFAEENKKLLTSEWKYEFLVLNEGTRSELTIGKLSYKNKEVLGGDGHNIKTDLGEFRCFSLGRGNAISWIRVKSSDDSSNKIAAVIDLGTGKYQYRRAIKKQN